MTTAPSAPTWPTNKLTSGRRRLSNREEPCHAAAKRTPLNLGHLAAPPPDRRELLRVGHLVQGPPPELEPASVGLQPSRVAAERAIIRLGNGSYSVNVEGQNTFRLRGTSATLAATE